MLKNFLLTHIICWVIFISYELAVIYYSIGYLERPYIYFIFYFINISLFYIHFKLLIFTFNAQKIKYFKGIVCYMLLLVLYLLVKALVDYLINNQQPAARNSFVSIQGFLPRNIARFLYFTVLATFYWSAGHISYFRKQAIEAEKNQLIAEKEKAKLETQLTKSRNAYLQQQINPHILFNTLNFVYSSAQKYSKDAAQCILLLAEIMRFSLEEPDLNGKINLEREVDQIENMLALNRYRFEEPLHISIEMEGDFSQFQIIPLILLTLTENVFKHGNLLEAAKPAMLQLKTDNAGKLVFFTRNLKKPKNEHPRRRQAIGLENLSIRLDTAYANNYKLDISESGEFYELTLNINLCN